MAERDPFPTLQWEVTQEVIDQYAEVSGDRNPLHIDPEFARGTRFKGTISHGFLTLAWLSQWATAYFGPEWLDRGELDVAFIGAVRPGDTVTVSAEHDESTRGSVRVSCRVGDTEVLVGVVSLGAA